MSLLSIFSNPPEATPRLELIRQRERFAHTANLEEIPRKSIEPVRFGTVTANRAPSRVYYCQVIEASTTPVTALRRRHRDPRVVFFSRAAEMSRSSTQRYRASPHSAVYPLPELPPPRVDLPRSTASRSIPHCPTTSSAAPAYRDLPIQTPHAVCSLPLSDPHFHRPRRERRTPDPRPCFRARCRAQRLPLTHPSRAQRSHARQVERAKIITKHSLPLLPAAQSLHPPIAPLLPCASHLRAKYRPSQHPLRLRDPLTTKLECSCSRAQRRCAVKLILSNQSCHPRLSL